MKNEMILNVFKDETLELSDHEAAQVEACLKQLSDKYRGQDVIVNVSISAEEGELHLDWKMIARQRFERIRRITGYLTGTVDRWNNGKKAELHDRLMHA